LLPISIHYVPGQPVAAINNVFLSMLKRGLEVILHLLFWGATSWFIISTFAIEGKDIQIKNGVETVLVFYNSNIIGQLVFIIFLAALVAYASVFTITKQHKSRVRPFLLSVLYLALVFLLFIIIRKINIIPSSPVIPYSLTAGIFLFYFISGITYAVTRLLQKTDLLRKQMEVEKKEAELSLLRSQLHPHFLFNVLNSLLSMVDRNNNPELTKSILGLSDLLRYVVNESSKGQVPVKKEIEFINNYVSLQSLRFEKNELNFHLNVNGAFTNQKCEPGVFIPFLENAFKYGTEPEN
jgi:sensor histidine kinase YesM